MFRQHFVRVLPLIGMVSITIELLAAADLQATTRDYTIVTSQSSIALSGNVVSTTLGTANIQQQGPGSLTTSYSGTIKAGRVGSTIEFLSGNVIDANVSGNWRPLADGSDGTSPADYGGKVSYLFGLVSVNFAGRDLVAGLTSERIGFNAGGQFDLSTTTVTFATGNIAYRTSTGSPTGSEDFSNTGGLLSGTGSISSTFQNGATTETLDFPVSATFAIPVDTATTINLTITGRLVATASFPILLPGDYSENGEVDAADYLVWRDNFGSSIALANDDTAGVGTDDFTRWQTNFGAVASNGASAAQLAGPPVPEPVVVQLLTIGLAAICGMVHVTRRQVSSKWRD